MAKVFAESEFEKYRIVQDRLFESDFDKHIRRMLEPPEKLIEQDNREFSPIEEF